MVDETSRAILYLLYEGRTFEEIFQLHPNLNVLDVSRAAGEGLRALEEEAKLRVETRAERIARVRATHPRAFEPWTEEEDARLLLRWKAREVSLAALARALGRPSGAVRMRLEKLLGEEWREKGGLARAPRDRSL
ncbi:MAG TPA: hypothetical protein VFH78_03830 [Candidatus Thermoplasmatota archaeon]|nr:hypothetical protein [Candidatus Thermoplasmatota archaeon]